MAIEKTVDFRVIATELVNRINEDTRRIRLLEQRVERIEARVSETEKTILTEMDDLKISLERITNKINSFSEKLGALENEILKISKALEKAATKAEVKELEAFIEIFNPIKSKFVTKDELEKMLKEKKA